MIIRTVVSGLCMAAGTVYIFSQYTGVGAAIASTMTLTTLAAYQWFHAWNCRSRSLSLTKLSLFGNMPLVYATGIVIVLQLVSMYTPIFQKLLHTTPLTLSQWLLCIAIASSVIVADEARKLIVKPSFS